MAAGLTVSILINNNSNNLRWLLPELKRVIAPTETLSVEYLVVDTQYTTDDASKVCREFGVEYVTQEGPGYGEAFKTAVRRANKELLLILDTDELQDYTQIPKLLEAMTDNTDMVIGSRYVNGGTIHGTALSRAIQCILNTCFRIAIGVAAKDCLSGYRVYRTEDIRQICLNSEDFEIIEEVLIKLKLWKGANFTAEEIPISSMGSNDGRSKYSQVGFIVRSGRMLLYSLVLRLISGKGYEPRKHDARAWKITDLLLYGGVGALTTLINLVVYFLLDGFHIYYLAANAIAWLIAVLFSFAANKTIVFNNWSKENIRREFLGFVGSRLVTGALDMGILWLFVDMMDIQGPQPKIFDSVIVIILNYILGRTVFRKKGV